MRLRMNRQRLDRSPGLTHFTDEETDRRRWRELPKVASGSAMIRARSPDSQALLFPHLSAGSPKTYSLMEFWKGLTPVTPGIFLL